MKATSVVLDHFTKPRNVGTLAAPCGEGLAGSPPGQPFMRMQVRIAENCIQEARFLTYGCVPAIAAGSYLTSVVTGMQVSEALLLQSRWLITSLGGLPPSREFCADLAVGALHSAITDALQKEDGE